jgi:hypothetical protein
MMNYESLIKQTIMAAERGDKPLILHQIERIRKHFEVIHEATKKLYEEQL